MRWGFYNKRYNKLVPYAALTYDPTTHQVVPNELESYDPATHRLVEKFEWDPDNFETREELEAFLTEFLGFEPDPEGIHKKPMTFDWETDVAEEIIVLDRQVKASATVATNCL